MWRRGVSLSKDIAPEGYFLPWTEKQIREDTVIQDKLRVLKRSGLALPYEMPLRHMKRNTLYPTPHSNAA